MKYDIFISYRRADRELVASVVRRLEARGVGVWYDAEIEGGADWRETIVEALTDSDMLAIFFSEDCNNSRQLKKELAVADSLGKPVVPILIENTQPRGAYLYELADRNWIQVLPDPMDTDRRAGRAPRRCSPASRMADLRQRGRRRPWRRPTRPPACRPRADDGTGAGRQGRRDRTAARRSGGGIHRERRAPRAAAPRIARAYVGRVSRAGNPIGRLNDVLPFRLVDLALLGPIVLAVVGYIVCRRIGAPGQRLRGPVADLHRHPGDRGSTARWCFPCATTCAAAVIGGACENISCSSLMLFAGLSASCWLRASRGRSIRHDPVEFIADFRRRSGRLHAHRLPRLWRPERAACDTQLPVQSQEALTCHFQRLQPPSRSYRRGSTASRTIAAIRPGSMRRSPSDKVRILLMREGLPLVEGSAPPSAPQTIGSQLAPGRPLLWLGRRRRCCRRKARASSSGETVEGLAGVCAGAAGVLQPRQLADRWTLACSRISGRGFDHGCVRRRRGGDRALRCSNGTAGMASAPVAAARTQVEEAGWKRKCEDCGAEHFPRVDPVAIMLAVQGDKCLMGRQKAWRPGFWSCLAGFVEPGETIEQAAAREIFEEAGVRCSTPRGVSLLPALAFPLLADDRSDPRSRRRGDHHRRIGARNRALVHARGDGGDDGRKASARPSRRRASRSRITSSRRGWTGAEVIPTQTKNAPALLRGRFDFRPGGSDRSRTGGRRRRSTVDFAGVVVVTRHSRRGCRHCPVR